MILLVDNYDSFVYNLVQYLGEVSRGELELTVIRNDALTLEDIAALQPSHIVLSPGPCSPNEAGLSIPIVQKFSGYIPILGVCLGHQAIAQAFGAKIVRANQAQHGKTCRVSHNGRGIFAGLPQNFTAARYHSLATEPDSIPDCIDVTAHADDGTIMGIQHRDDVQTIGLQFHPESILTEVGRSLLVNFLISTSASCSSFRESQWATL